MVTKILIVEDDVAVSKLLSEFLTKSGFEIHSAKSAEEATAAGFEVGTRNIVEVLNSQRSLYQAQRDYSRAKHDYLLNILRLKRAAGSLEQEDIIDINSMYPVPLAPLLETAYLGQAHVRELHMTHVCDQQIFGLQIT